MENEIFYLIKFGKKEHLENLFLKGEIYFNLPSKFNDLFTKNNQQGDDNEGANWILNDQIDKINVEHPTLGNFEFKSVKNSLSKIKQYNYYFLSFSLYVITSKNFIESGIHVIDEKMLEFGNSAVVISNPKRFLDSIFSELQKNDIEFEANFVEYKNLENQGKFEITPFTKKNEHSHQMEFRIIIANINDKPKLLSIGSIESYSDFVSSKFITETIWKRNVR